MTLFAHSYTSFQPIMVRPVSACVFTVALVTIGAAVLRLQAQTDVLSLLGRKALVVASQEAQQSTLAGKAAVGVAADAAANPPQINSALQDLIKRLPKAELHIHIEGTLEAAMMMRLAQRNNISLPYANVAEAEAARSHFQNLQSFLDAYQIGLSVLVTEQDFYELAGAYLEKAAANNITHAEIFFDVQSHVKRGVKVSTIVTGLQAAMTERASHPIAPVAASLILCLVRELGEAAAAATLALTLPYLPSIDGLGLASTEIGYPPEKYKQVYTAAGLLGLHKVAHAGEEGGPEYVWQAIKVLGAQRIDHGIHSLEDPALVDYMAQHNIPITLCPISNQKLQVYGTQLPQKLSQMLACGIPVTINSDDPAYFGPAYLNANYEFIAGIGGLEADQLAQLAKNSFSASFISDAAKAAAHKQIDDVLVAWKSEQQQQQQQQHQQQPQLQRRQRRPQ